MGVSILFDNKKYKGPKSFKKCFKNLCSDVRDLEKTISHDIFIQIGSGIIFFGWISTHFKQFLTFSFFFPCAHSRRGLFFAKNSISRGRTLLFSRIHHFFNNFCAFFAHFPPLPPPNPYELRPCTYETQAAYHLCLEATHGLGGAT